MSFISGRDGASEEETLPRPADATPEVRPTSSGAIANGQSEGLSLQDEFAAKSICFGCGPANPHGLRIKSFVEGDVIVARFVPAEHHHAFPGVLNGGIIGALLDCHSNWTACYLLMMQEFGVPSGARPSLDNVAGSNQPIEAGRAPIGPPCTVTADFHVVLKRPTPMSEVRIEARASSLLSDRATIEATMTSIATGKVTATCTGTFVAVKENHPAYHRW